MEVYGVFKTEKICINLTCYFYWLELKKVDFIIVNTVTLFVLQNMVEYHHFDKWTKNESVKVQWNDFHLFPADFWRQITIHLTWNNKHVPNILSVLLTRWHFQWWRILKDKNNYIMGWKFTLTISNCISIPFHTFFPHYILRQIFVIFGVSTTEKKNVLQHCLTILTL